MFENLKPSNQRIVAVDVLRGLAVMAIVLLHSIEHFNFYVFPEVVPGWMEFTDKAIWDSFFFLFGGKAYAVFALLFGFGFYIQYENERKRGRDFRLRFLWRMVLLFLLGQLNAMFFTGEVLTTYAILGVILPLLCRLNNRTLMIVIVICMLQPIDLGRIIYALMNPEFQMAQSSLDSHFWNVSYQVRHVGNFWQTAKMNLWEGQLASMAWALLNGRVMQILGLFLLGLFLGRKEFFVETPQNKMLWLKLLGFSLLAFFPLYGLTNMLPDFVSRKELLEPLNIILSSLHKLSFMFVLVTAFLLVYYLAKNNNLLNKLAPFGKMSLSNYIFQSIIGSFLFYSWGLYLGQYLSITYSLIVGIILFLVQWTFCVWWLKTHRYGPFEAIWRRLTWIGTDRYKGNKK
ncbi:MAG: DUF418 domain-containing protein [Bacteroidales bacterium]|nr:DUF418 domain-containing protein [Bacteroidales bacterium]